MDDVLFVRGFDSVDQLQDDGERVIEIERPLEVLAFDILHDQVVRPYIVELAGIRVVERCDGAHFLSELPGELSVRDFDRHIAAHTIIVRAIDLAHSTLAHERKDLVGAEPVALGEKHGSESDQSILWGNTPNEARGSEEHYLRDEKGLSSERRNAGPPGRSIFATSRLRGLRGKNPRRGAQF